MKNLISFSFLFLLAICFTACQKDIDIVETIDSKLVATNVFGLVTDAEGDPVEDALVTFKNQSAITDEYGSYLFKNVNVDTRYNHLNIIKEGYFESTKTFRNVEAKTITLHTQLMATEYSQSIGSDEVASVKDGNITVSFDGKGFVQKVTGQPYSGEVRVAIKYLDPLAEDLDLYMPGDLSGSRTNGEIQFLESFGMVGVELRSTSNEPLQLAEGSQAEISAFIPDELKSNATETIPLWHFDHSTGLWIEEGAATKQGDTYVGKVSHFSFWNFDLARPPVICHGRVIDSDGKGISNARVYIVAIDAVRGGSGSTNIDGTFAGPIEKNKPLILTVRHNGCTSNSVVKYEQEIGPFDTDVDLGDITLDATEISHFDLNANLLDCDLSPVTDGIAIVSIFHSYQGGGILPVIDGKVEASVPYCDADDNMHITFKDKTNLKETILTYENIEPALDLGDIVVCDLETKHMIITSQSLGKNFLVVDSIYMGSNGADKGIAAYSIYGDEYAFFNINYTDGNDSDYELGTYDISKLEGTWRPTTSSMDTTLTLESGTITIEGKDEIPGRITGKFEFEAVVDQISESHRFTGRFNCSYF